MAYDSLSEQERIDLATHIFSMNNEAALVLQLAGDDAQNFIDVIDGVGSYTFLRPGPYSTS